MTAFGNSLKIILLCVSAAITYGILNDQIAVRVSLEYFTIGHVPIFGQQPLTVLAILWGITGTWWVGLAMGVSLAIASTAGKRPRREAKSLIMPVATLLLIVGVCALIAGCVGYYLVSTGTIQMTGKYAALVEPAKRAGFMADAFANDTSYVLTMLGSIILIVKVWLARKCVLEQT